MVERQVRYYFETDTGDQVFPRHKWIFLIINEPREIKRIKERIYKQLNPMDLRDLGDFLIKGSGGLHCYFFSFSSEKAYIEDKAKIYSSKKFREDRNLWERGEVSLDDYFNSVLSGKK